MLHHKNKEDRKKIREARALALLLAWFKHRGFKDLNYLGKLSGKQLAHLRRLLREKKFNDLAGSDDHNQLWQLIQIEKGITEQNWMLIRQNEQMMRQNDEIIAMMKKLRVVHHKKN